MQNGGSSGDRDRNGFRKSVVALLLIHPSKYITSCLRQALAGWGSVDLLDGRGLFAWIGWLGILLGVGSGLVII